MFQPRPPGDSAARRAAVLRRAHGGDLRATLRSGYFTAKPGMNILVLAPHPDDESIGCGGAIFPHANPRDRGGVVFLTSRDLGVQHLTPPNACALRQGETPRAETTLAFP